MLFLCLIKSFCIVSFPIRHNFSMFRLYNISHAQHSVGIFTLCHNNVSAAGPNVNHCVNVLGKLRL